MVTVLDRNERHGLALVCPDRWQEGPADYVPLTDDLRALPLEEVFYPYLRQLHYCATHMPVGVYVTQSVPKVPGWERLDALERVERLRR
jgi:hypothetical protein